LPTNACATRISGRAELTRLGRLDVVRLSSLDHGAPRRGRRAADEGRDGIGDELVDGFGTEDATGDKGRDAPHPGEQQERVMAVWKFAPAIAAG
jgi:hypothetical protein